MSIVRELQQQADFCRAHGSPLSADVLEIVLADYRADGASAALLDPHHGDPAGDVLGLRLLGALHYAVLDRQAPALALYYPSVGGFGAGPGLAEAVLATVAAIPDLLAVRLRQTPQTNEVGRAAGLFGGLLQLPEYARLPLRYFEVGSSAGLNLRLDHFAYRTAHGVWGKPDSQVQLDPAWHGSPPRWTPHIVERGGSDPRPVKLDTAGRLNLTSFIWCDQLERFERLRRALELAQKVPASLVTAGAAEFAGALRLEAGHTTVLAHSVMWQYLDRAEQQRLSDRIAALGAQASVAAPFAYLTVEPETAAPTAARRHLITLHVWPEGERRVLGWLPAHGVPARWTVS